MIEKKTVCQIVDEWLDGKEYFLVEVTISPDDKIVVEIDHKEGVWIEDFLLNCAFLFSINSRIDPSGGEVYPGPALTAFAGFSSIFHQHNGAVRPILPISVYSFPYVDHGVGQSFFNSSRNEGKTSNMIAQMTVQFVSS